jgi:hypothetical protein
MKDLIMISSYCNTKEKEEVLRNLVLQINNHMLYDNMTPKEIIDDIKNIYVTKVGLSSYKVSVTIVNKSGVEFSQEFIIQ